MTQTIDGAPAPDRYPEDPVGSFLTAADLAPHLCPGCATYHMQYTARRAARFTTGDGAVNALDRSEMIALLSELFAERAEADASPIRAVLGGSADTGLLATVVRGADEAGRGVLARTRFSVLDLCPTPLVLCAAYGKRHGLDVGIQTADFLSQDKPPPADIVVIHSVFRFIPHAHHHALLERLMAWLKPDGKLVFSMSFGKRGGGQGAKAIEAFKDTFREEVAAGRIPYKGSVEGFIAGLGPLVARDGDLLEIEPLRVLFASSDVRVESWREIVDNSERSASRNRVRVLAVLSRPG